MKTVEQKREILIEICKENIETAIKELTRDTAILNQITQEKQQEMEALGVDIRREFVINSKRITLEEAIKYVNRSAVFLQKSRKELDNVKYCSNEEINNQFILYEMALNIK